METIMNMKNSLNSDAIKTLYLKKSRFTEMLIEENALDQSGFESWIFCHGMLFDSPDKWWGDHGLRDYPHEGIDLCLYRDRANRIRRITEKTRIPVMQDGVVKAIFKDYLGKAVIIEHEYSGIDTGRFISFYAHINPRSEIEDGVIVKKGDIIALYTDGVIEAENSGEEPFSLERLESIIINHADKDPETIKSEIMSELRSFNGSDNFTDDITFILIKVS